MNKKVCWIIGASSGIGESLARNINLQNFNLILSSRDCTKLNSIKQSLTKNYDEKIIVLEADVCSMNQLTSCFNKIIEDFKKIDLVIFCSAIYQPFNVMEEFNIDFSRKTIEVNLIGFINVLHFILPQMKKQQYGHIAAVSSVAGYFGLPNSFAYGASKAGIINLCEGIYLDLKEKGINLSLINPGFVKTRLTDKNNFLMPFIISADEAAKEILNGIEKNKFEIHFPKKFTLILKILKMLPYSAFFFLIKKLIKK
jgi:short-subunit dehydrogenase